MIQFFLPTLVSAQKKIQKNAKYHKKVKTLGKDRKVHKKTQTKYNKVQQKQTWWINDDID